MPSQSQRASLTARVARYASHVNLLASYLQGRGLDQEAAVSFRLGCVVDPEPQDARFNGMLCIPYITARGDVIAVKFRRVDESEGPKYDSPSGQKAHLYNAHVLANGGPLVAVVEGELDAVAVQTILGIPCIGTPGTLWFDHYSRCFTDFDRVLVIADHDAKDDNTDPGRKHADKVTKAIPGAELILPPAKHDPTSWIQEYGIEAVKKELGL